jgi:DNA-binding transcriptional LysR family regulator
VSDIEMRHLRSFAMVADELNVTKAASRLSAEPVRRDRRMVALPAGHRLAARESVTLADLADEPVIIPEVVVSDDVLRHWLAEPRPDGRQAPRGPAAQRIEDRLMLVARGKGI